MKKPPKKDHLLLRCCMALALLLLLAFAVHLRLSTDQALFLLASAIVLWVLVCSRFALRLRTVCIAAGVCVLLFFCCAVPAAVIRKQERSTLSALAHEPQASYFSGRSAMLIVPHQDDDVNLLGGVIERFARHGEMYVVFTTNGDYYGDFEGYTRIRESIEALGKCGVPEENVVFLGYGDGGGREYEHIYLEPDNRQLTSFGGMTHTYATEQHPPFREHPYTRGNLKNDLRDAILTYRPDTIFCVDYDKHTDHRCASMLFETAMGEILAASEAYRPLVYKGFAYLAWYADDASGEPNLISTRLSGDAVNMVQLNFYNWDQRFRLPVSTLAATRLSDANLVYGMLESYRSQDALTRYGAVRRGDKAFFRRYTDAVRTGVTVGASSGSADRLTDFLLADERETLQIRDKLPLDGVWTPDAGDSVRTARIAFDTPRTITRVLLYDSPSLSDNVRNAQLAFSDGTRLTSGPLHPNGAATEIAFAEKTVSWLTVTLTDTEGRAAGLAEIEAFEGESPADRPLLKLMDENGDFVYDYRLDESGQAVFYPFGQNLPAAPQDGAPYRLELLNTRGTASVRLDEAGAVRLVCGRGARGTLRVTSTAAPALFDEVRFLCPRGDMRLSDELRARIYGWSAPFLPDGLFARQADYYKDTAQRLLDKF